MQQPTEEERKSAHASFRALTVSTHISAKGDIEHDLVSPKVITARLCNVEPAARRSPPIRIDGHASRSEVERLLPAWPKPRSDPLSLAAQLSRHCDEATPGRIQLGSPRRHTRALRLDATAGVARRVGTAIGREDLPRLTVDLRCDGARRGRVKRDEIRCVLIVCILENVNLAG